MTAHPDDASAPVPPPSDPQVLPAAPGAPSAGNDRRIAVTAMQFAGPLPPPDLLAQYESIVPGSAERLIKQMEDQGNHRRAMERVVIEGNDRDSRRGVTWAGVLGLAGVALAAFAVHKGHGAVASIIVGTTLAALAGVFVYGTRTASQPKPKATGAAPVPPSPAAA